MKRELGFSPFVIGSPIVVDVVESFSAWGMKCLAVGLVSTYQVYFMAQDAYMCESPTCVFALRQIVLQNLDSWLDRALRDGMGSCEGGMVV